MTQRVESLIHSILNSAMTIYSKLRKTGYTKPDVNGNVTVSAAWGT